MREAIRALGTMVVILGVIVGLSWALTGNSLALYTYFAPRQEAVRRQVFEETKAYRQGMVQDLQNMQFQYAQATPVQQEALASIILHRAADVPDEILPQNLREFVNNLRRERNGQ